MRGRLPVLGAILLSSCGNERVAGGSTSETANGLTVKVIGADGMPAARMRVRLRPQGKGSASEAVTVTFNGQTKTATAGSLSATGYFFGKDLVQHLNGVTVDPVLKSDATAGGMFDSWVAPVVGYAIAGGSGLPLTPFRYTALGTSGPATTALGAVDSPRPAWTVRGRWR